MALAISGDREEAQELTQETFVRALQNLPRLKQPEKFQPWLRGIAFTVGKDVRRRAARERRHMQAAAQQTQRTQPGPAENAVSARESTSKDIALLGDLVAALPENCRIALDLRYREEFSYAQIAETMNVPVSTVRGLLYRATKSLRTKMKPTLKKGQSA